MLTRVSDRGAPSSGASERADPLALSSEFRTPVSSPTRDWRPETEDWSPEPDAYFAA